MGATILHVAEIALTEDTGMGRIACHWKRACEARGHDFLHIGPDEAGPVRHKALFPRAAFQAYRRMHRKADVFLVHEPASGAFVRRGLPSVVFSHGIERRGWEMTLRGGMELDLPLRWRTRLLFPLWRLRPCDIGLGGADLALVSNEEDAAFARLRYGLPAERVRIFRNGVNPSDDDAPAIPPSPIHILFTGTWIARKGIRTLARAAEELQRAGTPLHWILAGGGRPESEVLSAWPASLAPHTTVISHFRPEDEADILRRAHLFVLPSFFEGQPLSLLQAMEAGKCCIASDCCGQRDVIRHRLNGLLHAPGDAAALRDRIAEAARDEALRLTLGKNARLAMAGRGWEATSLELAESLESVIRSRQPTA